jgi:glycosyltransferase involved in cell wall biosynthesis
MKKILFISHEATLTGAPIVLYRFLKWIKQHRKDIECTVLLDYGGELEEKLSNLFTVLHYNKAENYSLKLPFRLRTWLKKSRQNKIIKNINDNNYDLIYSNTIVNGTLLEQISKRSKINILVHVHEMSLTIEELGLKNLIQNFSYAEALIANSNLVVAQLKSLQEKNGFNKPIDMVYPFVEVPYSTKYKHEIKQEMYVVGGSGSFAWRKGVEVFMYVAKEVIKRRSDVRFCWVGGNQSSVEFKRLCYLAEKLMLSDHLSFISPTQNPSENYKEFDLFFLSSIEEPFSLAAAECALLKIPMVCMQDCTGVAEILIPEGGMSFPVGDHTAIATGIINLLTDHESRRRMGERAREIVLNNATVDLNAPKLMKVIDQWLQPKVV